tara:strand:+ start:441 stop:584 length:144 start_codon:yes stop_codon:yes gene_type:complete
MTFLILFIDLALLNCFENNIGVKLAAEATKKLIIRCDAINIDNSDYF